MGEGGIKMAETKMREGWMKGRSVRGRGSVGGRRGGSVRKGGKRDERETEG